MVPSWTCACVRTLTHPCPPRDTNISWKGNCLCKSLSITSIHFGSPSILSSSWKHHHTRYSSFIVEYYRGITHSRMCCYRKTITPQSGNRKSILCPASSLHSVVTHFPTTAHSHMCYSLHNMHSASSTSPIQIISSYHSER